MKMRLVSLLLLVGVLATVASAASVKWTGGAGNSLWNFATNWDGNSVPTKDDDVILNPVGGATVSISQPAVAKSITIGGGTYNQALNLLSSLSVGSGGIKILSRGTLQLNGNNDLPLTTVGDVVASAGGSIVFNSGDIQGPGEYIVQYGADITFSGSALKQIEAANLTVEGSATIQPTTIQLSSGAVFVNAGDLTAVGQINIFSNDNSKSTFHNFGNFSYTGTSATAPLTFQLSTYFGADLDVVSGSVVIQGSFTSDATIELPTGTVLNVQSGPELKTFNNINGAGSVNVKGVTELNGVLTVSWVTIADSGSLTLNTTSVTKSLSVSGKLILNKGAALSATDVSIAAGTVTGDGSLYASGNFEFVASPNGDQNSFVSARVYVAGTGFLTGSVYVLFADAGNLNIGKGATFSVSSTSAFEKQTGDPVVTNNGNFNIRLAVGSTFKTSVDFVGAGDFSVTSGDITVEARKFNASTVNLGTSAFLRLENTAVVTGNLNGAGTFNLTADPSFKATIGDVALSYFGLVAGSASVKSLRLSTLEIFNGVVELASGTNTAYVFNFYGGTLSGSAKVSSTTLTVGGDIPQTLDGVTINTTKFVLRSGKPIGTLITTNGAQINAGSSTAH